MAAFDALIKFACKESGVECFASIDAGQNATPVVPRVGSVVTAYASVNDLQNKTNPKERTIEKVSFSFTQRSLANYAEQK